jgi:hypothetical protein
MEDDAAVVRALLRAAHFDPPEADMPAMTHSYAITRQMVGLLYTVDEAREDWPVLQFKADLPAG